MQHRADRGVGVQAERVVAAEVAEAVGDQVAVVPLEAAQHVRAGAHHQVGAGVDDAVGEGDRVTAVLAEEVLLARHDVPVAVTLAAQVLHHDDDLGVLLGLPDQRLGGRDVERVRVIRPGREAEQRDLDAVPGQVRDLAGPPGPPQPGARAVRGRY